MADLSINFAGISSPNPFWLASAPPSNSGYQVHKAFEAGWGGAVWKTVGPAVMNVTNRYGGLHFPGGRLAAINNLELISDRPLAVNLKEIREIKSAWPDRALVVSAMVEPTLAAWREITLMIEDTGADGIELNFGCPHGMSERKMGSAIGQVPEYCAEITGWVSSVSRLPVIAKLTPNVTDINHGGRSRELTAQTGHRRPRRPRGPSWAGGQTYGFALAQRGRPAARNQLSAYLRDGRNQLLAGRR